MIIHWINPEQLSIELKRTLKSVYILFGNDLYILQNSQLKILKSVKILYSIEYFNIELKKSSDWNIIFSFCKTMNLFSKVKILSLTVPNDYPILVIYKNISLLYSISTILNKIILILLIYSSNQITQHNIWLKLYKKTNSVFVDCTTPKYEQLKNWIEHQSKSMKLVLEDLACQLLCYYYEGNIILLKQILWHLSLIYPDGNLSFIRVKNIISDSAFFNINQWVEAILIGKKQRANRILNYLKHINTNLEVLLRKIQHETSILVQIKYKILQKEPLFSLLKQYKISKGYHHIILKQATQRLNFNQLYQAISLLTNIEIQYNLDYTYLSTSHFELLTEILCNNQNHRYHTALAK